MRTFKDYTYVRPNVEAFKKEWDEIAARFCVARNVEEAKAAYDCFIAQENELSTMANLYEIRFSINMNDAFYKREADFWNENGPIFEQMGAEKVKLLMKSPFLEELKELYPSPLFLLGENSVKVVSEDTLSLKQEENKLSQAYNDQIASAQIEFEGKMRTLPQMTEFTTAVDRQTRKLACEAVTAWFEEKEEIFDEIYDKMVKNRHQQAKILGFENFVEMALHIRNRFGYGTKEIAQYRKQVLEVVVPLVEKLTEKQAKRIGIEKMRYYDLPLEFLDGNAKPIGTTEEKVAMAQKMYHALSEETGEFFDFLVSHELLDLDSKKGKQSGGYCTFIENEHSPFIFANFNGTSGDVDVLTHEAGHAFQVYQSQGVGNSELIWPTIEAAEIFSMSMEFITYPWMDGFFGEKTEKYKFAHLSGAVKFLPYGVLVDHFQQEIYENPDWTPSMRKAAWAKLEKMYLPYKDYSESPALMRGIYWFRQGHIFDVPFYYIDYTLAQVVAFQFWKRFQVAQDAAAWHDYKKIAKLGGTKTFAEIVEMGNLKLPFKEGVMSEIMREIREYLLSVEDEKL